MNLNEFANALSNGTLDDKLKKLYGQDERQLLRNRLRYISAAENFSRLYPECSDIRVFSVPAAMDLFGSTEGCMLSAAIDRDIIAVASLNGDDVIRVKNGNGELCEFFADDEKNGESECNLRKMICRFASETGAEITGFSVYIQSDILPETGNAAEAETLLIRCVLDALFCGGEADVSVLKSGIGKAFADLSTSGGFALSDGRKVSETDMRHISFDLSGAGYSICVTDIGTIPEDSQDTESITAELGLKSLSECDEADFYKRLPEFCRSCTEGSVLAAARYFALNELAELAADSLGSGDSVEFLRILNTSGHLFTDGALPEISLAMLISLRYFGENGAVCVKGGRYVTAFLPAYLAGGYTAQMDRVFGFGNCKTFRIRSVGSCEITL